MPKREKTPITCDWSALGRIRRLGRLAEESRGEKTGPASRGKTKTNKSKLYKHKGFKWQGIKIEKYKTSGTDWADIIRQTLIGRHGETTKFHLRYFEIAPNGHSSFEKHRHEHVVICVRGKGEVMVGRKIHKMKNLDTLYIAPDTPHQLRNPFKESFGFFCMVNAKRDKPKILNYRVTQYRHRAGR